MDDIEIFLNIDETPLSFLSIPRRDIKRLAVSPFRWIRYVMFAICGSQGDLSITPNGPAVDYEITEIPNNQNTYYYQPSGKLSFCVGFCCSVSRLSPGVIAFVDYEGLNDRVTTSDGTSRRRDLREDVIRRDGLACVVTHEEEGICDAVHLIPHSKGDDVRFYGQFI